jgi:hypothetical protein
LDREDVFLTRLFEIVKAMQRIADSMEELVESRKEVDLSGDS